MQEKQTYENKTDFSNQSSDLFVVRVNKKYGFIDRTGKIVIEPQLEFASNYVEGLALVRTSSEELKLGFIDRTGKFVVSPRSGNLQFFSEGLAAVGIGEFTMHGGGDHKFGFIDKSGNQIIETNFREARAFSEDLAAVMNEEGKWGYIDKTGKAVIPFQFEDAFSFSEDLACVLTNGLFGFIDKSGKIVIQPRFAVPSQFKEGLAAVELPVKNFKPNKYYGTYVRSFGELMYIDKAGNTAVKLDENIIKINDFSEGLAVVDVKESEKKYYTGFINTTGEMIVKLNFDANVQNFSEGLASFYTKDKFGFLDKTGKVVIKPEYSLAEDFHSGLARVEKGKDIMTQKLGYEPKAGYIDKTGKVIWQPTK